MFQLEMFTFFPMFRCLVETEASLCSICLLYKNCIIQKNKILLALI